MSAISLKKVLAKLLNDNKKLSAAYWMANSGTTNRTDSRVWVGMSSFSNSAYSHQIVDTEVFTTDVNGLKVLKDGWYFSYAFAHFNTSAVSKPVALRIYNYTQNSQESDVTYGATPFSYVSMNCATLHYCNAGDIILPQFQKYADDTTTGYRPSRAKLVMIKLF